MNKLSDDFQCMLGVRQGECLSPFLFSLCINDLENVFINSGAQGIDVYMYKVYLMLYADDIVIFGNSAEELQKNIHFIG